MRKGSPVDAATLYAEHAPIVAQTARAFARRHGTHPDDAVADGNMAFMLATTRAPADGVTMERHIKRWVWYELFDAYRTRTGERRKNKSKNEGDAALERTPARHTGHWLFDFLDELSEDAKLCVKLVLDTPDNVRSVALAKGGNDINLRSTIKDHLRTTYGWDREKINAAFQEVAEALVAS